MRKDSKIYVAGHRGLAGSAILRCLGKKGCRNLVCRNHSELDLTRQAVVEAFFEENGRISFSWRRRKSAGSWPTARCPPSSFTKTSPFRPTSFTPHGGHG
jgi:hypothetical protein